MLWLLSGPPGFTCWISFAAVFSFICICYVFVYQCSSLCHGLIKDLLLWNFLITFTSCCSCVHRFKIMAFKQTRQRNAYNTAHAKGGQQLSLCLTGVTALWSLSKTHLSQLSTGSTQEGPSLFN